MASHWTDLLEVGEDEKQKAGTPGVGRIEVEPLLLDEDPFSWTGPKTIGVRRTSQGFGFTLRHFIVYPPESAVHSSLQDEDAVIKGRQWNRMEPMDTIFVKQVKEGGPAHRAGLCTGDRLVKVNGESVISKTYSQVISLIQKSDGFLELCVMPKDEDILQLAYSQDAYLKGHEAYRGNAHNIPEPPPVCYPRVETKAPGMSQPPDVEPTQNAVETGLRSIRTGPSFRVEVGPNDPLVRSRAVPMAPDAAIFPPSLYSYPSRPNGRLDPFSTRQFCPSVHRTSSSSVPHQNIDWRNYQTYREYVDTKRLHGYSSRTIQERLDSLRATSQPHPQQDYRSRPIQVRRRSTSHERAYRGPPQLPQRSSSQERLAPGRPWPRSTSQDSFGPGHRAATTTRAHSFDYLEPGSEGFRRGYNGEDRPPLYHHESVRLPLPPHKTPAYGAVSGYRRLPVHPHYPQIQSSRGEDPPVRHADVQHATACSLRPDVPTDLKDQRGIRNSRLVRHTPHPQLRTRSESTPCPSNSPTVQASATASEGTDTVVLRDKLPSGRGLRHPSYILAVNDQEGEKAGDSTCWLPNDTRRELNMKRLGHQRQDSCSDNLDESLDSIPFIDEPSSPSVDHGATHIPASVISVTAAHPSPTSTCPLIRRQLSHDQESLRNVIVESQTGARTERSKSYDEGLDNYREEGRGRSSVKHIPSLKGLKKALDGHKSSDDSGSRRDSSSDIFSDSSKEGWLHFRQLNTDKSKWVGGGMRSWKQMYTVLRAHRLYLYKDRREALAHAASEDEQLQQPISIRACLIDISYSDTKRKNVLRLTTSDCEYLFQAEDRENMLGWIRVIQENGSLDDESAGVTSQELISKKIKEYNTMMSSPSTRAEPSPKSSRQSLSIRQTLLGGKGEPKAPSPHPPRQDHRDDSSPPRDRANWRKGIPSLMRKPFEKKSAAGNMFGVRLDDCPPAQTNRFVPLIVEVCCKLVEERGLEYTGIYRVPGNNAAISSMQDELNNKGLSNMDLEDDKWKDLNVISSLLKSFFRKLPDPLFTNEKYSDFIDANRVEDAVERLKALKRLLQQLPDHHYETLKFLCGHLKTVAENCGKNKMEPRNLAIVFGPTLVRTSEDNMTHMVTHMPDQYKIVETLIQNHDWFFTEDGNEEPMHSVVQLDSAVDSQPVPNIDHLLRNIGRTGQSPGEVSDSATSDSARSKGSWGSGKEQYSRDLLRSSIFVNRKRKKAKDKLQPSSSDDDLDSSATWRSAPRTGLGHEDGSISKVEEGKAELPHTEEIRHDLEQRRSFVVPLKPDGGGPIPSTAPDRSLSEPVSREEDITSDLGTLNSSCSQASAPRIRNRRRSPAEGRSLELAADVCSITSDYSTTSSMTFLTAAESSLLSPEVRSVAESRGDEADDERSELISEGRPMETDSESELSVFIGRKTPPPECRGKPVVTDSNAQRSFHSVDGAREPLLEGAQAERLPGSLGSTSQEHVWRLLATEQLKSHLRASADDMFGVGGVSERRKNRGIRRRHTMGGQRDFAELALVGDWHGQGQGLSAMDRLKPKCSSQDFSIGEWIARERLRVGEGVGLQGGSSPSLRPTEQVNGDRAESRVRSSLSLLADTHPQKLSSSHVVRSRFYQYL